MRRFQLDRDEDASGISGTGVVAQGVQFDDGTCAMRWLSDHRTTVIFDSVADIATIHGHQGRTRITWLDLPVTSGQAEHLRSLLGRLRLTRRLEQLR